MSRPRFLYLHGFGSGPGSRKGVHLERAFAGRGAELIRLDLRVPDLEHLRFSRMMEVVREAIGGEQDRAVVLGSSLGGLCAARVAAVDARVSGLVLLAPAFGLARRWRAENPAAIARWAETGWYEATNHVTGGIFRLDHGFFEELDRIDDGEPDVRVPTLIVHGRHDDVVPVNGSRAFARSRPHVRLVEVEDGHELLDALPVVEGETVRWMAPWLGGA